VTGRADLRLYAVAAGVWAASIAALYAHPAAAWWSAAGVAVLAGAVHVAGVRRAAPAGRHAAPRPGRRWGGARLSRGGQARLGRDGRGRQGRHRAVGVGGQAPLSRWPVVARVTTAALLGIGCAAASTAARTSARDGQPLAALARSHATVLVEAAARDDARLLAAVRPGPPTYAVPVALTRVESTGTAASTVDIRVSVRAVVFGAGEGWRGLLPSQRFRATVRLSPPRSRGDLTAAVLTATGVPELLGGVSWVQRVAARLRAGLQSVCAGLPAEPGGLLPGLVIGDTSRLAPALAAEFRTTGLTHLVAVSGANVVIILSVVLFVARWCRAGPYLSAAACAVCLIGFVILVRPSPSVLRAAAMGVVGLLALVTGRSRAAPPALAAAIVVCLIVDPALATDAGFALSSLATAGLVLVAPRWRDALRSKGLPAGVAEALAVPAAAQIACGPVIAGLSGGVSLIAVPANLLAAPAVAPATLAGVAAALLSPLWTDGAATLAWLASWPARWLVAIASHGAAIPAGTVPWPAGVGGGLLLGGLTVVLLAVTRVSALRRLVLIVAIGVAAGAVPVRMFDAAWPPDNLVVAACDVGQGDAVVLPVRPGEAVVVDSGPDPVPVDGCLKRLGVRTVVLLVITHFHVDHVGGVAGVFRGRRVEALLVPSFPEPTFGARLAWDAARVAGLTPVTAAPGWTFRDGDLSLEVLGPSRRLTGTRSDPNNNSVVMSARSRGVRVLLPGDAETEEQRAILADVDRSRLRADVLKVAHHGSAYQDPDLIAAVGPAVALVSVGRDNPYGHPNPALLASLSRAGVRVSRTDDGGDLAVVTTTRGLGVVAAGSAHQRQALLHAGATLPGAFGAAAVDVRVWRHEFRLLGRCLSRDRRRGTARVPGRRGRGGGFRRASTGRWHRRGAQRGRHDGRGPPRRGEPVPVRRAAGGRRARRPGRQEGAHRRDPHLRQGARAGRRARGRPRRWREGQGALGRTTRGGGDRHQRWQDH
jgi:competence protein ComEC